MKTKTQALKTSLAELTLIMFKLLDELEQEQRKLGIKNWKYVSYKQKILIPIINKEGLSDTWRFKK